MDYRPLAFVAIVACGSVKDNTIDGAVDHADAAPGSPDAGASIDAALPVADAAPPVTDAGPPDASGCSWIVISTCDTGGTVGDFCPDGKVVATMRRCDGTTYVPDPAYLNNHLCNCSGGSPGTCCGGVSWSEIQCCD